MNQLLENLGVNGEDQDEAIDFWRIIERLWHFAWLIALLAVIGAVAMYIILRYKPYRHMGKNNINKIIEEELANNAKEETTI